MAGRALTLRLKARDGQHVVNQLTLDSTVKELKSKIAELTKVPEMAQKILSGFPPKLIDLPDSSIILSALNLRSGDTLIVEEDSSLCKEKQNRVAQEIASQLQNSNGFLTRQVVPANNSCLFTSVNFVMESGKLDLSCANEMRQIIARIVSSDKDLYSEALLGKTNKEYCDWILNEESWGGAIEVSILSQYYQVEISVVDTQSLCVNRFGEDKNYPRRVLLIYDGIHYDPLMMEHADPTVPPKTFFSTSDESVISQALELASEAKASRQYTDVAGFSLRCLICSKLLNGQVGAQAHAKESGHINFGEV